jgi:hypothetical protein
MHVIIMLAWCSIRKQKASLQTAERVMQFGLVAGSWLIAYLEADQ